MVMESASQIAARHGAVVAPGVTVTRLPRGASSRPLPIWDGARLVYPDGTGKDFYRKGNRGGIGNPRTLSAALARRPRVIALHGEGMTDQQIADALGISYMMARNDRRLAGLLPNDQRVLDRKKQRDRLVALISAGHDDLGIAELMGLTVKYLRKLAEASGLMLRRGGPDPRQRKRRAAKPKPEKPRPSLEEARIARRAYDRARRAAALGQPVQSGASMQEAAAARRIEVARCHAEGLSMHQTMLRLGDVTWNCIRNDRRVLGLAPTEADLQHRAAAHRKNAAMLAAQNAKPPEEVARLIADLRIRLEMGQTGVQIAAIWGESYGVVRYLAKRHGIRLRPAAKARCRVRSGNGPRAPALIDARAADVTRMRAEGLRISDIAAALGTSDATISADIKRLGLAGKSLNAPALRGLAAQRPALVAEAVLLDGQGLSPSAIGRRIGYPVWTVRRLLRAGKAGQG